MQRQKNLNSEQERMVFLGGHSVKQREKKIKKQDIITASVP